MEITIYHNPRCSKSRRALALLRERGIEAHVVEYLKTPPTAAELSDILARLGMSARELIRTKEAPYRELRLHDPALTETELIRALVQHPILIERPIVLANGRAALGRPPERVLEIL